MTRRRVERPRALLDLSADDFALFKAQRQDFMLSHPELGELLKRAGNEYLAIGWRMHFDAQPLMQVQLGSAAEAEVWGGAFPAGTTERVGGLDITYKRGRIDVQVDRPFPLEPAPRADVGDTRVECPACWEGTSGPHPHTGRS